METVKFIIGLILLFSCENNRSYLKKEDKSFSIGSEDVNVQQKDSLFNEPLVFEKEDYFNGIGYFGYNRNADSTMCSVIKKADNDTLIFLLNFYRDYLSKDTRKARKEVVSANCTARFWLEYSSPKNDFDWDVFLNSQDFYIPNIFSIKLSLTTNNVLLVLFHDEELFNEFRLTTEGGKLKFDNIVDDNENLFFY